MTRTETLQLLHQHKAHLVAQFGVTRLALFGSTARDVARADSDGVGGVPKIARGK
ncbi:MAG: hypothetical protein PHI11_04710 [Gallionella sp.]|nr:hypothetical protein [Gallionella sp.]